MVAVTLEASSATELFEVEARAQSIEGAVHLVAELYSHCLVRVSFPIDPECFFVEEPRSAHGLIEEKQVRWAA